MNNVQIGSLVTSKQGRDKDKVYIVLGIQGDRVILSDGKVRPIKKPKVKNIKHISPLSKEAVFNVNDHITDEKIAHSISTLEQNDN